MLQLACDIEDRYGIITTKFITQAEVPKGEIDQNFTDLKGIIILRFKLGDFTSKLEYLNTNDYQSIPCKPIAGILAILGKSIECILVWSKSAVEDPQIQVKNFKTIPKDTFVEIHVPEFYIPNTASVTITIATSKKRNR